MGTKTLNSSNVSGPRRTRNQPRPLRVLISQQGRSRAAQIEQNLGEQIHSGTLVQEKRPQLLFALSSPRLLPQSRFFVVEIEAIFFSRPRENLDQPMIEK